MNSGGFQVALAHLLVDNGLRKQLQVDSAAIHRRFSLSQSEIRALDAFDHSRFQLMVDAVAGKRVQLLRRALPATLKILEMDERGKSLLRDFIGSCVPWLEAQTDHNRLLADSHRMAAYLQRRRKDIVPRYLADLASYEALRIDLVLGIKASLSAAAALPPDYAITGDWAPQIGSHVVLREFEHDVISIASEDVEKANLLEQLQHKTYVGLRRQAGSLSVTNYRIGRAAFEALQLCNGTLSVFEICAAIGGGERARKVRSVLSFALKQGYFMAAGVT